MGQVTLAPHCVRRSAGVRRSAAEKQEIIHLVEHSALPAGRTLDELDVPRSSFSRRTPGRCTAGISSTSRTGRRVWSHSRRSAGSSACPGGLGQGSRIPAPMCDQVVQLALAETEKSARQFAPFGPKGTARRGGTADQEGYFVSESSVFRLLKRFDLVESPAFQLVTAADRFAPWPAGRGRAANPPAMGAVADRLHLLQDPGLGRVPWTASWAGYLSTVLDDSSRHILAWKLAPTMAATEVQDELEQALAKAKLDRGRVRHRPRLLSDNGPCYVSGELGRFLEAQAMEHTRGAPCSPKAPGTPGVTQRKIERYHRSMTSPGARPGKNLIQLQNYAFPWDLEGEIGRFVDYYNHQRYYELLDNVTPADVNFGRVKEILTRREEIKRKPLEVRRHQHTQSLRLAA